MRLLYRVVLLAAIAGLWLGLVSCSVSSGRAAQASAGAGEQESPAPAAEASADMSLMVRSIAGIAPGETTEDQVVEMYGPGVVVLLGGGSSARYYSDAAETCTLKVISDFDGAVISVLLSEGLPSAGVDTEPSPALKAPVPTDRGIALGDSVDSITQALGKITRNEGGPGVPILVYESTLSASGDPVLYSASYVCPGGGLRTIEISIGE